MMAVGDMKYKFIDNNGETQELEIPATVLRSGKRAGLTNRETVLKYAADQGYAVDAPKEQQKKSTRTRKPDEQKKNLINIISEVLQDQGEVTVVNEERQIQVSINGEIFEITMVKKRKPKV